MTRYGKIKIAFLKLLNDRPYVKVSMTELARASGMSRQNIYRNYPSKDKILSDILEDILESVLDNIHMLAPNTPLEIRQEFIRLLYEALIREKDSVRAIFCGEAEDIVYSGIKSFSHRLLGHIARINHITIYDEEYFNLISLHISGSIFQVIKIWIKNDMNIPAERMARIHQTLLGDHIIDLLTDTNFPPIALPSTLFK